MHVECLQWWKGKHKHLDEHKKYSDASISAVSAEHLKQLQALGAQRKTFVEHRKKLELEKTSVDQQVLRHTLSGKQGGNTDVKLDFTSCLDMFQSQDPAVVEALGKRRDIQTQMDAQNKAVKQNQQKEAYTKSLKLLLDKIKSQLRSDQEEHEKTFTQSRTNLDSDNQRGLITAIPLLLQNLQQFVAFNGERRQKAQEKLETREAELAEHIRLYQDDAPSERKDLETKVKEMVSHTTRQS